MSPEEIQILPDELLLNKLMLVGAKSLATSLLLDGEETFNILKDLRREVLSRMHYGKVLRESAKPVNKRAV